ncbi:adenylyltransferase/cytidyltransferase family protein [Orbus wheelerorum]|uniref:adenylyltransferase/cytidyltransferase family protein n=1 Tax=Orbus wheelerorum TaxID=3074111 RepID=UPI00370DA0D5
MTKIITYGTFDYFHYGHFMLLKRAAALGSSLIVGLSSDEFNLQKNKQSLLDFDKRKEVLESLNFIDSIFPENSWEQKVEDIKNHNIDILVMGSDWNMKFDYLKKYCDVVYLERTPKISTSLIKEIL